MLTLNTQQTFQYEVENSYLNCAYSYEFIRLTRFGWKVKGKKIFHLHIIYSFYEPLF